MMKRVMGLDSGGSKTLLALADSNGRLCLLRKGQSLDPQADKQWPDAFAALLQSVGPALATVSDAVLGLPRYGESAEESRQQESTVAALLPFAATIENDVRIAFDGALPNRAGVLILAGTGSMAWASHHQALSEHIRVGGWGEDIGDEGSAYWIGNQGIIAACRHLDGRSYAPALTLCVCQQFDISAENLIEHYFSLGASRRKSVAALAQAIAALAEAGDLPAQQILRQAAQQLAEHLLTAWRRIDGQKNIIWSYAGGVFSSPLLRSYVTELVGNSPVSPLLPPVGGALLRAAQQAGWQPGIAWINQLASDLKQINNKVL